jgi:4-hydroxy-tetrahydrodipicolinate synthase
MTPSHSSAVPRFQGCGTAIVTPFTERGEVDFPALRELVDWQITEGIGLLVPCGSTGEAQTLSEGEREQVVAAVVEAAAGRGPVMAGATSNDTARAVDETRRMCRLGVDYILSASPYYNKPTQTGLYRHFSAVADAATKPVCLYNIPSRTAVNIGTDVVLKLAEHPNIMGVKESSGDLHQVMELVAARPERFSVLAGDDWLALPIIAAGGDGLVSVTANQVPREVAGLVAALLAGDLDAGRREHYRLLPLIDANFLETNPSPVKAGLHAMGKIKNVVRLPLVPVSDATYAVVAQALRERSVHVTTTSGVSSNPSNQATTR